MTEIEQKVIELHKQELIDTQIAKIINKSPDTVAYYRKKHNLINNYDKNSILNTENALNDLKNGELIFRIAKKYKISNDFVRKLAKKNNIKTQTFQERVNKQKFVLNNPFKDLDNKNVQYWLGFLAADGSIFKDRISLGLQEKDKIHIDKYKSFLGGKANIIKSKKIIDSKTFIGYRLNFRNKEVVHFLNELGLTTKKSFTLNYKGTITNNFLRGVIDGDGYIRKNHFEISICTGSKIFANQLKNFIINYYKVNCTIREDKSNIYTIGVYGINQVTKVLKELYYNADTYLERKYLNATGYRNISKKTP